jgi:hypothetical protein
MSGLGWTPRVVAVLVLLVLAAGASQPGGMPALPPRPLRQHRWAVPAVPAGDPHPRPRLAPASHTGRPPHPARVAPGRAADAERPAVGQAQGPVPAASTTARMGRAVPCRHGPARRRSTGLPTSPTGPTGPVPTASPAHRLTRSTDQRQGSPRLPSGPGRGGRLCRRAPLQPCLAALGLPDAAARARHPRRRR